jgi:hypothetical protein
MAAASSIFISYSASNFPIRLIGSHLVFHVQEARAKNEFLLKKAQRLLEEQEDEIKQLNEMIISAKCHAIREAQIAEKQVIKAELAAEEARLDEVRRCL